MCGMCVYVWQWPVCGQLVFVFTSKGRWIREGESWRLAAELNSLFQKLSRSLLLLFWLSSSALRAPEHQTDFLSSQMYTHTETAEKDREDCDFVVWLGDYIKFAWLRGSQV